MSTPPVASKNGRSNPFRHPTSLAYFQDTAAAVVGDLYGLCTAFIVFLFHNTFLGSSLRNITGKTEKRHHMRHKPIFQKSISPLLRQTMVLPHQKNLLYLSL